MTDADKLRDSHGLWASHKTYTVEDWQYEVANNDTRMGYWMWVAAKIDTEG